MASPGLLPRPVLVAHTPLPARDSMEHITFLPTDPSKSSTLPQPRASEQRLSHAQENKLELYKKYVSCLCALCITCIVLTLVLLSNTIREDEQGEGFEDLRRQVMDLRDTDLAACYRYELFDWQNRSYPPKLVVTDYLDDEDHLGAVRTSKVVGALGDVISYSGFLRVDAKFDSNLFFWFVPRQKEPEKGPLLLWLQGGPGWPSMYGMFKENGPFLLNVDKEGAGVKVELVRNIYSWHKVANILYIDNPVGTGFSHTNSSGGYPTTDAMVAEHLAEALRQFMILLPIYIPGFDPRKNPFYAFGESYGGPYVLALAVRILSDESLGSSMNLRGVGLGNPLLSPHLQMTYSSVAEGVGYVSREELAEMRQLEEALRNHIKHNRSSDALGAMVKILDTTWVGLKQIYDMSYEGDYLRANEYFCYLQDPAVMAAIHVGRHQCKRGYRSYQRLEDQILTDKRPLLETLLNTSDVKVLLYTGNMDMMIHALGMNRVVASLISW